MLVEHRAERLQHIIREVCDEHKAEMVRLEIMPDHVHLVVECDPQFGIHRLVRLIKGRSSQLLRQEFPKLVTQMPTLWTNCYFVSTSTIPQRVLNEYLERARKI